jgi:hypothetical protein
MMGYFSDHIFPDGLAMVRSKDQWRTEILQSMTAGLIYDSWTRFENAIPARENSFDWQSHSMLLNDNHITRQVYPLMARYAHFGGTLSPIAPEAYWRRSRYVLAFSSQPFVVAYAEMFSVARAASTRMHELALSEVWPAAT